MISWRDRGRGGNALDGGTINTADGDVSLPLGPGEWEEALGLPLCVVCQNVSSPLFCLLSEITNAARSLTEWRYWKRNARGGKKNSISSCNSYAQSS